MPLINRNDEPERLTGDLLVVNGNLIAAIAVVSILGLMIVPVPPPLLDILLTFNMALAMVMLLVTVYLKEPLAFTSYPSLLLMVTLFRLSLNVASTRLILSEGHAGSVIDAFGQFVVRGNFVIGIIVFLILILVQFVVITRGAGRVAEVAARFTLDAMPGKQMAIDADLNTGIISEQEARDRRSKIAQEAEFYGAMDGASKFVRGDAIAGILITVVNIVGGLVIGSLQRGLPLGESARTYTLLTVGDGLVSQIPALVVSVSAGILVTRTATDVGLGASITRQLVQEPKALFAGAGALAAMALIPGLPTVPFMVLAVGTAAAGFASSGRGEDAREEEERQLSAAESEEEEEDAPEFSGDDLFVIDRLELEIGYGLISLVDATRGGDLLNRITNVRHKTGTELGFPVAPIRIRDNLQLAPHEYSVKLRGVEISRFELKLSHLLAMRAREDGATVKGVATVEPAFRLPAVWIKPEQKSEAEMAGHTVVEPGAVVATHVAQIIKSHADEILTRQDTKEMMDQLKAHAPALVEEVFPEKVPLTTLHGVLRGLLHERVPVRDLVTILETLAGYVGSGGSVDLLVERVREALSRELSHLHADTDRILWALTCHPETEQSLFLAYQESERSGSVAMDPLFAERFVAALARAVERAIQSGKSPLLVVASPIRLFTRRLLEASFPNVAVLAYTEIAPSYQVRSLGTVIAHENAESPAVEGALAGAHAAGSSG